MNKILLVEPRKSKYYHSVYPPFGLLKLAAYHEQKGDMIKLVSGIAGSEFDPDIIYITSLFTYAWEPVHEVIRFYSHAYKKAKIIVGGIYASLCPDHLKNTFGDSIEVHRGPVSMIDNLMPAYWLFPEWDSSIIFSSRGCIRECSFCLVPKLEPSFVARKSIKHLFYPGHRKIILWDNNILASPYWKNIFTELNQAGLEVDFNQGLDARLLTEEVVAELKKLKLQRVRLSYDNIGTKKHIEGAVRLLKDFGFSGRNIVVYCLFNYLDNPQDLFERIRDLVSWGVVSYPMRYQSLEPNPKDSFVSTNWTKDELEMVARARRVIGWGGAFPPYEGFKRKILEAKTFDEAFSLRPSRKTVNYDDRQLCLP